MKVEPPTVDAKPFDDSVWQKNAQTVIGGRSELEREAKKVEKAYREAHEAKYESRRKAVDEDYQNAILNLNIKIDNQKAMHHPWTKQQELDEEKAGWENQRELLKEERGMRQQELAKAWEREVNAYVQSVMGPKLAKWHEQAKTALDQQKSESVRKQSDVQQRDTAAMQQEMQMTAAERLQQRAQIKAHPQRHCGQGGQDCHPASLHDGPRESRRGPRVQAAHGPAREYEAGALHACCRQ